MDDGKLQGAALLLLHELNNAKFADAWPTIVAAGESVAKDLKVDPMMAALAFHRGLEAMINAAAIREGGE